MQENSIRDGNQLYQDQLIRCLFVSLGQDEAIDLCVKNGWSGPLAVAVAHQKDGS